MALILTSNSSKSEERDNNAMTVSAERFAQGMTLDEYKAQMKQNNERFAANEAAAVIRPEDVAFFKALPEPLNVLVITEDWCGDALANVPVLGKLAQETGKFNLRIFLRDQNLDLADQYLKEGKYRSVPVFVFFDEQMRELGHFIERPTRVTAEMAEVEQQVAAEHPERPDLTGQLDEMSDESRQLLFGALRALREQRREAWANMLIEDIEALLANAGVGARG